MEFQKLEFKKKTKEKMLRRSKRFLEMIKSRRTVRDFSEKNMVEQGFVFEQLFTGHQCGCGESFTPVKDLKTEK